MNGTAQWFSGKRDIKMVHGTPVVWARKGKWMSGNVGR